MQPAGGVRREKLRPHQLTDALSATNNLFLIAHLGVPRVDSAH
jgi:sulfane dehydrogenase subunit SoxC